MHLNDAEIELYLNGGLPADERARAERHLAECSLCSVQLGEARATDGFVHDRLQSLDGSLTQISLPAVLAAASRRPASEFRYAAGFVLMVVAAAAAYALPGSPVREWVHARFASRPPVEATAPAPAQAREGDFVGVALDVGERYAIEFSTVQPAGVIRITIANEPQVVLRTESRTVTFSSDVERMRVRNQGSSADYEIRLPSKLVSAEIRVAGRVVFRKSGSSFAPPIDAAGRLVIPVK